MHSKTTFGWGWTSIAQHLSSMCQGPVFTSSTTTKITTTKQFCSMNNPKKDEDLSQRFEENIGKPSI